MPQIDWSLLGPPVNYGEKFMQGMEAGRQIVKQRDQQNALAAFAQNPDDPRAAAAMMGVDPRLGFQLYSDQRERATARAKTAQEQQDALKKTIGHLAKGAKDATTWDASVDYLVANGVPNAAQYKGKFSPEARSAMMAEAGVDEASADGMPAQAKFYEWLKVNKPDLAEPYIRGQATDPPRYFSVPQGGSLQLDPSYQGPTTAAPASEQPVMVATSEEKAALPPGTLYKAPDGSVRRKGGAGPSSGPATFP